jgi:ankyrin repeat protein
MRALEQSVREGRIQLLASLLEPRLVAAASAPLPGTTDKSTLLHLACELGNTACAQLLVEWAPQSQHARTRSGCTPLLLCCAHGQGRAHCEGVRLLARAGTAPLDARRKADGAGAAHLCAAAGCAQCLQLLLTKAPQLIDARDRQYRSVPPTLPPTVPSPARPSLSP